MNTIYVWDGHLMTKYVFLIYHTITGAGEIKYSFLPGPCLFLLLGSSSMVSLVLGVCSARLLQCQLLRCVMCRSTPWPAASPETPGMALQQRLVDAPLSMVFSTPACAICNEFWAQLLPLDGFLQRADCHQVPMAQQRLSKSLMNYGSHVRRASFLDVLSQP